MEKSDFELIKTAICDACPHISSIEMRTILSHISELVDDDTKVKFQMFWDKYPKKVGKYKTSIIWKSMSGKDMIAAVEFIPTYLSTCDIRYMLMPENYLREKRWRDAEDEKKTSNITKDDLFTKR